MTSEVQLNNLNIFTVDKEFNRLKVEDRCYVREHYREQNSVVAFWAACCIFIGQLYFFISDILSGFFCTSVLAYAVFITEFSVLIFSGTYIYNIFTAKKRDSKITRIVYLTYYFLILFAICVFLLVDVSMNGTAIGAYMGFFFFMLSCPAFKIHSIVTGFAVLQIYSFILFIIFHPANYPASLTTSSGIFIASLFLRSYFIKQLIYKRELSNLSQEMKTRSETDFLTGASSRYVLYQDYDEKIENTNSVAVMMFDVDDFKKFNDGFSHLDGDICLKKVSGKVREIAEVHGGKIYRFGGEEFIVMFFNLSNWEFRSLAREISEAVYNLQIIHAPKAKWPYVSISAGGIYSGDKDLSLEKMISIADEKLYKAKENGKNCVVL